jgi:hypothetical protein
MKNISTQVFDEFTAHNLSEFARKSTVKKYLAPQDSPSIRRRIRVVNGHNHAGKDSFELFSLMIRPTSSEAVCAAVPRLSPKKPQDTAGCRIKALCY